MPSRRRRQCFSTGELLGVHLTVEVHLPSVEQRPPGLVDESQGVVDRLSVTLRVPTATRQSQLSAELCHLAHIRTVERLRELSPTFGTDGISGEPHYHKN